MGTPLPTGPVFRINAYEGYSAKRSVTTLKDGTFVVTWVDATTVAAGGGHHNASTIRGQVFYANGDKLGEEFLVSAPAPASGSVHRGVNVVALEDGGFVVSYSHAPDGSFEKQDVWLRVYEADRSAGAEIVATQDAANWQDLPLITALNDGGFVLSYLSNVDGVSESVLLKQHYDASGARSGSSNVVGNYADVQSIATLRNGNIVVAYEDYDRGELIGHIYRPDGSEVTQAGGIVLPSTLDGYQLNGSITALADGRFVVVWTQTSPTAEDPSTNSVRARIFDADGNSAGDDFQINVKTSESQRSASVAALPNGGFAVAFEDWEWKPEGGIKTQAIRIVSFGPDGSQDGEEIVAATGGDKSVEEPSLSALADGRLLLTWTNLDQFKNPHSMAQVFDPRVEALNWAGSDEEDNYVGTAFNDTLRGLAGSDRLYGSSGSDHLDGGLGSDSLDGGSGDDTFLVDSSADSVIETADGGSDMVYARTSYALASGTEVETLKLSGVSSGMSANLTGSDTANKIMGHAGRNSLKGQGGDDKLWGGVGNDVLTGGSGRDTFVFDAKLYSAKANRKKNLDKLSDFRSKDDTLWLDNAVFKKLGAGSEQISKKLKKAFFTIGEEAEDRNDYIVYNKKTGKIFYDADGSGSKAAVEFAQLKKGTVLKYSDFYVI